MIVCCINRRQLGEILSEMTDQVLIMTTCLHAGNLNDLILQMRSARSSPGRHDDKKVILCLCLQAGNPAMILNHLRNYFEEAYSMYVIVQSNRHRVIDERVNRTITSYALHNNLKVLSVSTNQSRRRGGGRNRIVRSRDHMTSRFMELVI